MPHEVPVDGVLDLHTFVPRDVTAVVDEYLSAAAAAGLNDVRLIHGRGTGVQRAAAHAVLARHPGSICSGTLPNPTWEQRSPG